MPANLAARHKWRAAELARRPSDVDPSPEILAAREDLAVFGRLVAGKEAAPIHRSWFPYLVTGRDSECLKRVAGPPTNLLSFRGSAKTTWLRIWIAWVIGHNPHAQIAWISYNERTALKSSRVIKRIIESPIYQQIFPHIRPGPRWADLEWEIDKAFAGVAVTDADFTLSAIGITGAVVSNRFHLGVFDDLIKSSQAIANEEVREKMSETYAEAIQPCLLAVPGSRMVSLGTRFRRDDIHCTEFTQANGWEVLEQSVITADENGVERLAWDRLAPQWEELQKVRQRRPLIWAYQWLCKVPAADEEQRIKPEWIQYCPEADIPRFIELVLGIDLAASEDDVNNPSAFVLGGRTHDRIYLLECLELRQKGNYQKIQSALELWRKWRHKADRLRLVFGKPAYQKSFEGDWEDYRRRYKVQNVLCEGMPERLDKDEKLEAVSGVFEDRIVYLNSGRQWGKLTDQLLLIDQDLDDLRDACYFALSKLQRRVRRPLSSA